jgi:cytochrome c-type biogenesis protein CcmH
MTSFWIAAGIMLAGALAWLLRPLLRARSRANESGAAGTSDAANIAIYRAQLAELDTERHSGLLDGARYEEAKRALMRRLALDVGAEPAAARPANARSIAAAVGLALALPLAAIALYLRLGNPAALGLGAQDAALQREAAQVTPEKIDAMVRKLEDFLKHNPDDAKGWSVLARTYRGLGKMSESAQAFERAVALAPSDAQLKIDFAEVLATIAKGDLQGRPAQLAEAAIALDPNNPDALALAGSAAGQRGDNATAIHLWERLLGVLPADAEVRPLLQQRIGELRAQGAAPALQGSGQSSGQTSARANAGASISVKVSLAPALAAKVAASDTLFVFARAAQGPKMPLAVIKAKPSELPHQYTLSDANAMTPEMALSKFDRIVVGARVSKSGTPTPNSGDLEGISPSMKSGASVAEVIIDRVVP